MKRNAFGEPIAQPGDDFDDFALPYMEMHDLDGPPVIYAAIVSHDPNFGWTAEMNTEDEGTIQAHDFTSRDDIMRWLSQVVELELNQIREES